MGISSGSCSCGEVEYSYEGDPINSVFCYCKECQISTGSDKWFGLWIPNDNFKITKGNPLTHTRVGSSGKDMNKMFCGTCGTTVCVEVVVGGFYSVAVSTLKAAGELSPKMAIYTASAPPWAVYPAGIPKYDTLPSNLGG
ncbi:MAG: hypothetical protein COB04_00900 [Gammaproteobacteria bacterium]|nr:MAG: hypothetical protein COB04_00900 [Gammaproteobacteria bacterium]